MTKCRKKNLRKVRKIYDGRDERQKKDEISHIKNCGEKIMFYM